MTAADRRRLLDHLQDERRKGLEAWIRLFASSARAAPGRPITATSVVRARADPTMTGIGGRGSRPAVRNRSTFFDA